MLEVEMCCIIRCLADLAGIDWRATVAEACMDWEELKQIAADPLCTIGAHTPTYPMLAKADAETMRHEISASWSWLQETL